MASALRKAPHSEDAVQLDVQEAISAAILRAEAVPAKQRSILDLITKEEWIAMDASSDNILVFDPE